MKEFIAILFTIVMSLPTVAFAAEKKPAQREFISAYNFKIEIEGVDAGAFSEITGLESSIEVIEYQDGDDPLTRKRPGRTKYSNITLKRGYQGDNTPLANWFQTILNGKFERKRCAAIFVDQKGNEVLRYNLSEVWPSRHNILVETDPVTGKTYLVEEIELAVEKIERNI